MGNTTSMNREEWLTRAGDLIVQGAFRPLDITVPPTRYACGWPLGSPHKVLGQCFDRDCSDDGHFEVFVSPTRSDTASVVGTLLHELCHAVLGVDKKHGREFKELGQRVGLTGNPKSMMPTPETLAKLLHMVEPLGPYPHAAIVPKKKEEKQSATRKKMVCPTGLKGDHGEFQIWISPKYLKVGNPVCFCGTPLKDEKAGAAEPSREESTDSPSLVGRDSGM